MKIFSRLLTYTMLLIGSYAQLLSGTLHASVADLVIFSYNRPLQLYAFLESTEAFMKGSGEIHVIYRSDNEAFSAGYDQVSNDFNYVIFHKQGSNPHADFKPLTMEATFDSPSKYIIFAVDDIVVKDFFDVSECIDRMEQFNAYGFYLRMGRNLNWCYALNHKQNLPPMKEGRKGLFTWKFSEGTYDWGYPHSVDMTLFRKKEIRADFDRLNFVNPNTLEGRWAELVHPIIHRLGLCYEKSKIVNIPLNLVQTVCVNRHMSLYTAEELLTIFNEGKKMDINPLFQIDNPSAHTEYHPTFIPRKI